MSDVEDVSGHMSDEPETKPIRPIDTAMVIGLFVVLAGNVYADIRSSDYSGGILSVALVGAILAILGKNAGNLIGGGK